MSDVPDLSDDAAGTVGDAARRAVPDATVELRALGAMQAAHEATDRTRYRILAALIAAMITAMVYNAAVGEAQAASQVNVAAQLIGMQRQIDHIEQQVDRLAERDRP